MRDLINLVESTEVAHPPKHCRLVKMGVGYNIELTVPGLAKPVFQYAEPVGRDAASLRLAGLKQEGFEVFDPFQRGYHDRSFNMHDKNGPYTNPAEAKMWKDGWDKKDAEIRAKYAPKYSVYPSSSGMWR